MTSAAADRASDHLWLVAATRHPNDKVLQMFALARYALEKGHSLAQAASLGRVGGRLAAKQQRLEEEAGLAELVQYEQRESLDIAARLKKACPAFESCPFVVEPCVHGVHVRLCAPTDK